MVQTILFQVMKNNKQPKTNGSSKGLMTLPLLNRASTMIHVAYVGRRVVCCLGKWRVGAIGKQPFVQQAVGMRQCSRKDVLVDVSAVDVQPEFLRLPAVMCKCMRLIVAILCQKASLLLGGYQAISACSCTKLAVTVMIFYKPSLITVTNQKLITMLPSHTDKNLLAQSVINL